MEILLLDRLFKIDDIVEDFESLVWTERFAECGDFVLTVQDTVRMRLAFYEGRFLKLADSAEVMIVETRESENGVLRLRGESLISIFKSRIARNTFTSSQTYWTITNTPGRICSTLVREMVAPTGSFMTANSVVANGVKETLSGIQIDDKTQSSLNTTTYTVAIEYGDLFSAVKKLSDTFGFGFYMRLTSPDTFNNQPATFNFSTYDGYDRTTGNTTNLPVIQFSSVMDSLSNSKELRSISGYKNVCYAWAPNAPTAQTGNYVGVAYANSKVPNFTDFDRRTMMIACDDINTADVSTAPLQTAFRTLLGRRAANALANNNYVRMVDGEIVQQSAFKYNQDYTLGDIIELRSESFTATTARVVEYIRSYDAQGVKTYPTLSVVSE